MKRILVVTETFFPETFLINDLVRQWQKDGYAVDILTQWPSYPEGKIYPEYKNKYYVKEPWGTSTIHRFKLVEGYKESKIRKILNYWTFVRVGTKIAKKIGGDYDHILVHQTGPLTLALPAVAIRKKYGTPITIWTFDIWPDAVYAYGFPRIKPINWFLTRIINKVYGSCDNIMVSSKKFAETIGKYVPDKKIEYAPNWLIPEESVRSELRLDPCKFNFTFAGNISISQNLKNVVKGFAKAKIEGTVLNIVGDGSGSAALKEFIEKNNIDNVILRGRFPYNQVLDILNQSDALVLSLIADEGIEKTEPFKLQSYLTAGKPILGIIRGSGREIISEEDLGICADPEDINDIAMKFGDAVEFSRENALKIKNNSARLLKTRFNKETIINQINNIVGITEKIK